MYLTHVLFSSLWCCLFGVDVASELGAPREEDWFKRRHYFLPGCGGGWSTYFNNPNFISFSHTFPIIYGTKKIKKEKFQREISCFFLLLCNHTRDSRQSRFIQTLEKQSNISCASLLLWLLHIGCVYFNYALLKFEYQRLKTIFRKTKQQQFTIDSAFKMQKTTRDKIQRVCSVGAWASTGIHTEQELTLKNLQESLSHLFVLKIF